MTLNATYDIGQFDIIEFKILKKISFHIFFFIFSFLKTQCHMLYKCLNNVQTFFIFFVVCCVLLSFWTVQSLDIQCQTILTFAVAMGNILRKSPISFDSSEIHRNIVGRHQETNCHHTKFHFSNYSVFEFLDRPRSHLIQKSQQVVRAVNTTSGTTEPYLNSISPIQ